jgi:hypothetical protein
VEAARRAARLAALALLAACAAAGCGGDGDSGATAGTAAAASARPVGESSAGSVVQYADCGDWRAGTPAQRFATIRELRSQLTPQGSRSEASPLADDRAYALLQKTCSAEFAASLRLYKLYVRAQGFAPLSQ